MVNWRSATCTIIVLAASACTGPEKAVFVTTTKIGIDADITTRSVSIGYDRHEGFVGPVYDNGSIPPVIGEIESNLAPFLPEIRQSYATGKAALIASGDEEIDPDAGKLEGERRAMFFGTSTNIGFKAVFAADTPESVNLGYKRKEYSVIPIIKNEDGDSYGSVYADIKMNLAAPNINETKFDLKQKISTGRAAEYLAKKDSSKIRENFSIDAGLTKQE